MAYDEDDYETTDESLDDYSPHYCGTCKWLMEALRDSASDLGEAERSRAGAFLKNRTVEAASRNERAFVDKISKLERRRNAMLDVLAKHQQLEHQR